MAQKKKIETKARAGKSAPTAVRAAKKGETKRGEKKAVVRQAAAARQSPAQHRAT